MSDPLDYRGNNQISPDGPQSCGGSRQDAYGRVNKPLRSYNVLYYMLKDYNMYSIKNDHFQGNLCLITYQFNFIQCKTEVYR